MDRFSHLICLLLFSLTLSTTIAEISGRESQLLGRIHRHYHHRNRRHEGEIGVYELSKGNFSVKLTNYGATILSVILPDKFGKLEDVVLGYETVKEYLNDTTYFGAIVGRVANRIGGAQFTYHGKQYHLVPNEGKNMLHGGPKGFSRVLWNVHKYRNEGQFPFITFSYYSFDGEEGFPGNLEVKVTYKIEIDNRLLIVMKGKPFNKPTPINLAQHTYWNLGGHNSGNILNHKVKIFGSQITPVDKHLIPTGKFEPVERTPYDFRKPHTIGSMIKDLPNGYDINYVLDRVAEKPISLHPVAVVQDEKSGRMMELWTNKPGVQFYTANMLANVTGKGGSVYGAHSALCLETQGFPDSVNHPNFPSTMVSPREVYEHYMLFRFSTMMS